MMISTEISSLAKIVGEEKAIEMLAKAGFDAWDFSMFRMLSYDRNSNKHSKTDHPLCSEAYSDFSENLKNIGLSNGIHCNQSHAPFPSEFGVIDYLKRSLECTAIAGGDICVVHPFGFGTVEENKKLFSELLPYAKDLGVKIATENMYGWDKELDQSTPAACSDSEKFIRLLDAVDDDYFVACLDIGHAEMRGSGTSAAEVINGLGSKLQALHIHDNDKWHDSHQIPFSMNIDFQEVVDALKKNKYSGYFTLEADMYLSEFNKDNVFEGVLNLARAASKLADMFEMC